MRYKIAPAAAGTVLPLLLEACGGGQGAVLGPEHWPPTQTFTFRPLGESCEARDTVPTLDCANRCPRSCADLWDRVQCLQGPCRPGGQAVPATQPGAPRASDQGSPFAAFLQREQETCGRVCSYTGSWVIGQESGSLGRSQQVSQALAWSEPQPSRAVSVRTLSDSLRASWGRAHTGRARATPSCAPAVETV